MENNNQNIPQGNPLPNVNQPNNLPQQTPNQEPSSPSKKKSHLVTILVVILLFLILVLGLVLFLKRDKIEKTTVEELKEPRKELLECYPNEIVPIYEDIKVESIAYEVSYLPEQKLTRYLVKGEIDIDDGKDVNDTTEYYASVMDKLERDKREGKEFTILGLKNDYTVHLKIREERNMFTDYKNVGLVTLTIKLPDNQTTDQNIYYDDYPEIIELPDDYNIYSTSYAIHKDHSTGEKKEVYHTGYLTEIDEQDFFVFFVERYRDRPNFKNFFNVLLKWDEEDYSITATYTGGHTIRSEIIIERVI